MMPWGEGSSAQCPQSSVDVDIMLDGASGEERSASMCSLSSDSLEDRDSADAGTPNEFDSVGSLEMEGESERGVDNGKRKRGRPIHVQINEEEFRVRCHLGSTNRELMAEFACSYNRVQKLKRKIGAGQRAKNASRQVSPLSPFVPDGCARTQILVRYTD